MSNSVTRLYQQFQPESYDLAINLDRAHMHFNGTVIIKGRKTGRPSKRLTFHAKDLKITGAAVIAKDKKGEREIKISRINAQKSFHEIRLHSNDMLYPGEYTVTMEFEAPITPGMTGLYPCYFKIDDQEMALPRSPTRRSKHSKLTARL
jgi:aminopeptidase N